MINSFIGYVQKLVLWQFEGSEESIDDEQKIDFTQLLPREIVFEIFSNLNTRELGRCLLVSRNWKVLASHQALWNALPPRIAFGKEQWETYFGDIGKVPPLPKDIHKILASPCPFWLGKKVEETHMLVLIPETVNYKPLNLNTLEKFVKSPKKGYTTKFERYAKEIVNVYGDQPIDKSHWLLMTKDVIPKSINQSFTDQQALIDNIVQITGIDYEVPNALDCAICILTKYVSSGERLFKVEIERSYEEKVFRGIFEEYVKIRCKEKKLNYRVHVGRFSNVGLGITVFGDLADRNIGMAAVRKFF